MPEAGDTTRALDLASAGFFEQSADSDNFSTAAGVYTPTSPACEGEFVASTGGHALVLLMVRWDSDNANEEVRASVEVREDDSSGTVVHSPALNEGISNTHPTATAAAGNIPGWVYIPGVIVGQTYWVQMQLDTQGGQADIFHQSMMIIPLP